MPALTALAKHLKHSEVLLRPLHSPGYSGPWLAASSTLLSSHLSSHVSFPFLVFSLLIFLPGPSFLS